MSVMVDRPGTFRGKAIEHGVSESRGGFPQLVLKLQALEFYDESGTLTGTGEPGYVNWSEYDQEIPGYLVLYTKKDEKWTELRNCKQVKACFGWDGKTFEGLDTLKMDETLILFRVEPHAYNGTTTLQVTWIDKADASPTKTLPKYDAAKLQGLTAKFAGVLSDATPTPAAAKPPTGKPTVPPKAKGKTAALPSAPATAGPASAAPSAVPSTATPPPASPVIAPPVPSGSPSEPETKESAWAGVNSISGVTLEKLAEVWIAEGSKIGKPEEEFTTADWATVKNAVLKATSKF